MAQLEDIHLITYEKLKTRFSLQESPLQHPFPQRPLRMLGIVKIDGRALHSVKFLRVLIMKTTFMSRGVRSIFLCPQAELHQPVFSCESIFFGKKRVFLVDVQQAFPYSSHNNEELFDKLMSIRETYSDLLHDTIRPEGKIMETFSKASCYVKLNADQDSRALALYHEYLDFYLDVIEKAHPVPDERLPQARQDLDTFVDIMINHDPAMKIFAKLFGKKGSRKRALELFYNR